MNKKLFNGMLVALSTIFILSISVFIVSADTRCTNLGKDWCKEKSAWNWANSQLTAQDYNDLVEYIKGLWIKVTNLEEYSSCLIDSDCKHWSKCRWWLTQWSEKFVCSFGPILHGYDSEEGWWESDSHYYWSDDREAYSEAMESNRWDTAPENFEQEYRFDYRFGKVLWEYPVAPNWAFFDRIYYNKVDNSHYKKKDIYEFKVLWWDSYPFYEYQFIKGYYGYDDFCERYEHDTPDEYSQHFYILDSNTRYFRNEAYDPITCDGNDWTYKGLSEWIAATKTVEETCWGTMEIKRGSEKFDAGSIKNNTSYCVDKWLYNREHEMNFVPWLGNWLGFADDEAFFRYAGVALYSDDDENYLNIDKDWVIPDHFHFVWVNICDWKVIKNAIPQYWQCMTDTRFNIIKNDGIR